MKDAIEAFLNRKEYENGDIKVVLDKEYGDIDLKLKEECIATIDKKRLIFMAMNGSSSDEEKEVGLAVIDALNVPDLVRREGKRIFFKLTYEHEFKEHNQFIFQYSMKKNAEAAAFYGD